MAFATLGTAGFCIVIVGTLPLRLSINRRATMAGIGTSLTLYGGLMAATLYFPKTPYQNGGEICFPVIAATVGLAAGLVLAASLRFQRRLYLTQTQQRLREGPFKDLIERYLDVS